MITFQLVDMLRKYSLYILLINFIYQYYVFFHWYLSDQQIQIENAFSMGLIAFLAGIIFILFVHIIYFPRSLNDSAQIPTYPPLIMLLSLNLGFLGGISNLYLFQLYSLPNFLDIFRSSNLGFFIIIISFVIIYLSVGLFKKNNEDPNPTTASNKLITSGIFKYTRNPMYLALVIFQIGIGMSLSFLHISLMSIITVYFLHNYVIKKEEVYLKKLFGKEYDRYLNNSRRWI